MGIITTEQADAHLRLDLATNNASPPAYTDARLPDVELKIMQAEAIILDYLKTDIDVDGSPPGWAVGSPPLWSERDFSVVQAATLMALDALYDDTKDRTLADYMAPGGIISLLLMRLRDPALA